MNVNEMRKVLSLFFFFTSPSIFMGREMWFEACLMLFLFYLFYFLSGFRRELLEKYDRLDRYFIFSHVFIFLGVLSNKYLFYGSKESNLFLFTLVALVGYPIYKKLVK